MSIAQSMSQAGRGEAQVRRRPGNVNVDSSPSVNDDEKDMHGPTQTQIKAMSSSLESIHVPVRSKNAGRRVVDGHGHEVEMSMLQGDEEERERLLGVEEEEERHARVSEASKAPMSARDKRAMVLLVVLCAWCFPFRVFDPNGRPCLRFDPGRSREFVVLRVFSSSLTLNR